MGTREIRPAGRRGHKLRLGLALALGLGLHGVPVPGDTPHDPRRAVASGQVAPLDQLLSRVAAEQAGRVLKVELEWEDDPPTAGWVYEVKVLTPEGQLLKLHYQARILEPIKDP